MAEIAITIFVDFVIAQGTRRITIVRDTKEMLRRGYDPATDFWKGLREAIVAAHRERLGPARLDEVLETLTDEKKRVNYPERVGAYKEWMRSNPAEWVDPPSGH